LTAATRTTIRGMAHADSPALALLRGSAVQAAPRLLGWRLSVGDISGIIAETEAYQGEEDLACHASKGRTPRTTVLYGPPGTLYVYLCYGMHQMLNIVTDREGIPSAVLIRGLLIPGLDPKRSNGPGKVARLLGLDRRHHGRPMAGILALEPPATASPSPQCGPRVGVGYAGPEWSQRPWRWWLPGFPAVPTENKSVPKPMKAVPQVE
jgi:DNA-3-methyladenine glycosylase